MKKLAVLSVLAGLTLATAAQAANVTLYYSPTCPHCHHAREFIAKTLVYEYPTISVTAINVMDGENLPLFQDALKKCEYSSGGVPVLVIGDKCFQGYADFMQDELRDAVAVDLTDEQKKVAAENKAAMANDADAFRANHANRSNVIAEGGEEKKKKSNGGNSVYFWGLLIVLVAALGGVMFGRRNKK